MQLLYEAEAKVLTG